MVRPGLESAQSARHVLGGWHLPAMPQAAYAVKVWLVCSVFHQVTH